MAPAEKGGRLFCMFSYIQKIFLKLNLLYFYDAKKI